ncbi:MAG: hypothetical protein ACR2ID_10835 [Chthoniobacterales bacterium]
MTASRPIVVSTLCIALLLLVQGLIGLIAPHSFVGIVRVMQTPPVIYAAAVVRVTVGIVLLRAAYSSRLPAFLRIFGGFVLLGGLLTPFFGMQFAALIFGWWSAHGVALVRLFAAVSLALGLVVGYAMSPAPQKT